MNDADPRAVAVRTCDREGRLMIGYVPRYLAYDISQLCLSCQVERIEVAVERINRDAPLQHRLLCRLRACWPPDFQPCSGQEFQPLVTASLVVIEDAKRA